MIQCVYNIPTRGILFVRHLTKVVNIEEGVSIYFIAPKIQISKLFFQIHENRKILKMDWLALFKLLILQMASQNKVNDESTAVAIIPNDISPSNGSIINSESLETKNSPGNDKSYESPTFPSYSCSMPYPPPTVDEKPIEDTDHRPHNKVTMIVPLTVFHKLPDSPAQQLHR